MRKISPGSIARRDRVAECHTRASADRLEAEGMDTSNGRRKLELSAETWDARAELLGRLDASFNKREQLDAAARLFHSARGGEVGASVTGRGSGMPQDPPRLSDEAPKLVGNAKQGLIPSSK